MGLRALTKQLERLSYTDTMLLAREIARRLQDKGTYTDQISAEHIAEIIAEIGLEHYGEVPAEEMQAMRLLHKTFARKRSLVIVRQPIIWQVSCGTVVITDQSLPDAINLTIDQMVAQQALGVSKK